MNQRATSTPRSQYNALVDGGGCRLVRLAPIFLAATFCCLAFVASASAEVVKVAIKRAGNGQPVAGVRVTLSDFAGSTSRITGPSGVANFEVDSTGPWDVRVSGDEVSNKDFRNVDFSQHPDKTLCIETDFLRHPKIVPASDSRLVPAESTLDPWFDAFFLSDVVDHFDASLKLLSIFVDPVNAVNILTGPLGQALLTGPFAELAPAFCDYIEAFGGGVRSELPSFGLISTSQPTTAGTRVRITAPLLNNLRPAFFAGDLDSEGNYSNHGVTTLSSFVTDGAGSLMLGGEGAPGAAAATPVSRLMVYPDAANFVHRVYELSEGDVSFRGNWLFPPGVTLVGPTFGGAQFKVARLDPEHAVVVSTYSSTFDDLPDQGSCQPFTEKAEVHVTVYSLDGTMISSQLATTLDGAFGPSCGRPIWTELEVLGDGVVTTVLGPDEGVLLVHTDTGVRDAPGQPLGPLSSQLVGSFDLPTELRATGFFNLGSYGDAASGDLLFDVPFGLRYEWSADAARLGIAPETVPRRSPRLDPRNPVAVNELAASVTGLSRVGVFDEADLPASTSWDLSTKGVEGGTTGATVLAVVPEAGCVDNDRFLCLNDNRFALSVNWQSPQGNDGHGHARPLTNDSGTFWFFQRANRELMAKVIDGCAFGGHYWVFVAGLTNVAVQIEAWDRLTGEVRTYTNPQGRVFEPVLDTSAFSCSPEETARALTREADSAFHRNYRPETEHGIEGSVTRPSTPSTISGADGTACGGDPGDLCLTGNRFRVEVEFTDHAGSTGQAFGGSLTDETGALFFFDPSNAEMLIKVLDSCGFNDRFWVFAAGLTDVGVDIRVTDTTTGASKRYSNPRGRHFQTITDTSAFATCPG